MEPEDDKTRTHITLTKDTMVGHYRIVEKIGAGGMGEVYLAQDTQLDRKVALKFLPPHLCQDEDCRKRFKREAQAAAKLSHPNIITIHEVSEYQGRPFFAMEHVEGRSLKEVVAGRDLTIEQVLELAIQICSGLHAAHEKGVTHRDIKPSNILIDSHGRARIVDFGLAAVRDADQLTKTGSTMGTVGYMSPEQVLGKEVDHRSDLFSLGVVLYELIAKQSPFRRDSEAATMKAVSDDHPEPLARFKRDIPEGMQAIIDKALEKDVSTRYQHADGMCSDLMRVKRSLESTQTSITSAPAKKKDKALWWVAGSVAVMLAIVLWFTQRKPAETVNDKPEKIMLAVLPFENLGDAEDEYFADGVAEEIRGKLTGIGGFRVTSRTSAMHYKDTEKSLRQIGQELGVDYVLEGTIRWDKSGDTDRVRIMPRLIHVADDAHLWADTYERPMTQVFAVQGDIAEKIAFALNVNLFGNEKDNLRQSPTANVEAYDYYLRGCEVFYGSEEFSDLERTMETAINLFEKAVALDTTFLSAYAQLAIVHSNTYWYGYDKSDRRSDEARLATMRAMNLDSADALARTAMGYYYYYIERDFTRALTELEIARRANPNNAEVLRCIGYIKRRMGKWEESYHYQKQALELDPLSSLTHTNLIQTARYMRKFEDADSLGARGLELFPEGVDLYVFTALICIVKDGDVSRARQLLDSAPSNAEDRLLFIRSSFDLWQRRYEDALAGFLNCFETLVTAEDSADCWIRLADTYYLLGDSLLSHAYYDTARVYLEALNARGLAVGGILPPSLGLVYSRQGEKEKAIEAARRDTARLSLSDDAYLGPAVLADLATTYTRVGEFDKALDIIDTLLSIPSHVSVAWLRIHPEWDPLRDHPRFKALIEQYEKEYGT